MSSNILLIAVGLFLLWLAVTGRIKNLAAAGATLTGNPASGPGDVTSGILPDTTGGK